MHKLYPFVMPDPKVAFSSPNIIHQEKSKEESFDVVNFEDEVLYRETRSKIHELGLLHRAVHIFVFNRAGQLFLQKRSMNKDTAPGKWVSSCSGHVDAGESYKTAALRELSEEIGLSAVSLEPLFKVGPCRQTGNEFVWVYRCISEGPFVLDPSEISDGKWVDMETLKDCLAQKSREFAWSFVYLWDQYSSS